MIFIYHFLDRYPLSPIAEVEEKEPWATRALYIHVRKQTCCLNHSDTQWIHEAQATLTTLF